MVCRCPERGALVGREIVHCLAGGVGNVANPGWKVWNRVEEAWA